MIFRTESANETIRRPVVIIQLDLKNNPNIETFLTNVKNQIEKRTKITESPTETPSVNMSNKFKLKTWKWTSNSPNLNYKKYHPSDEKYTTTHHLVACYYRMGTSQAAEVFLVSNTSISLRRFQKYADYEFPLKITKR